MRLEEWQKFIESQFLDDEAEAPAEKTMEEEKAPADPVTAAEAPPAPKQTALFTSEVSEVDSVSDSHQEQNEESQTEPRKPDLGFVPAGKAAEITLESSPAPLASEAAFSLNLPETTQAKPPVSPAPLLSAKPLSPEVPRRKFELDSSVDTEIPDFAHYLNRPALEKPASLPEAVPPRWEPSLAEPSLAEPAEEKKEPLREATVLMQAVITVSEPPLPNHSPFQGEEAAPSPIPLPGRIQKRLTDLPSLSQSQTLPLELSTAAEEDNGETGLLEASLALPPSVVSEPSPSLVPKPGRTRGKNARNVMPQKPGDGLSAAELWASVPKHVQTLLAMERIEEDREVAQNSYKRPFAEKRRELIERLLDPVLSLEDTARLLNVCPTTVRRYTNKGILTHYRKEPENPAEQKLLPDKETRQRRFRLSDILAFLESQQAAEDARKNSPKAKPFPSGEADPAEPRAEAILGAPSYAGND